MKIAIKNEPKDFLENNGKTIEVLRLSIGRPVNKNFGYCTFRGDIQPCIELLEHALASLKQYQKVNPGETKG